MVRAKAGLLQWHISSVGICRVNPDADASLHIINNLHGLAVQEHLSSLQFEE